MDHTGHRERLRRRFEQEGLNGFAPHEALELLLTYALPRVDTNGLAHTLIKRFGSFGGVLEASAADLTQVEGIGPRAAALITLMVPLLRMYQQEKLKPRLSLGNYGDLTAYCRTLFLGVNVEHFYVLCLDAKLNLTSAACLSQGTPSEVSVQPRQVVQELIRRNAVGAVLCHNHPSGSPFPSQEDVRITREIQHILESMGIRLYDHIVISGSRDYSFHAHHLLDGGGGAAPALPLRESAPGEMDALAADRPLRMLTGQKNHSESGENHDE